MAILPELKPLVEDLVNYFKKYKLSYELSGFDGIKEKLIDVDFFKGSREKWLLPEHHDELSYAFKKASDLGLMEKVWPFWEG